MQTRGGLICHVHERMRMQDVRLAWNSGGSGVVGLAPALPWEVGRREVGHRIQGSQHGSCDGGQGEQQNLPEPRTGSANKDSISCGNYCEKLEESTERQEMELTASRLGVTGPDGQGASRTTGASELPSARSAS